MRLIDKLDVGVVCSTAVACGVVVVLGLHDIEPVIMLCMIVLTAAASLTGVLTALRVVERARLDRLEGEERGHDGR